MPKATHKKVEGSTPEDIVNGGGEPAINLTSGSHHVSAIVNVPAHQSEVVIARSLIEGCAAAAAEAWDKVKGDGDADFASMSSDYRRDLMYAAEGVYQSGAVLEGDSTLAKFEREVAKIKKSQDDKKKAAKAA